MDFLVSTAKLGLAHGIAGARIDDGEAQLAEVVLAPQAVVAATIDSALMNIQLYVISTGFGERCRGVDG